MRIFAVNASYVPAWWTHPIAGPTPDFTGGNELLIKHTAHERWLPTDTDITQTTGRRVHIMGGVHGGHEHM